MKVIAKDIVNSGIDGGSSNPHIHPKTVYQVIGFDDENFRVLNDVGEPILYPKDLFIVLDSSYPDNWVRMEFDDGQYYVNPPELSELGFYEDFFDGEQKALEKFNLYLAVNNLKCKGRRAQ